MKLNNIDRLKLANQYLILEKLDPENQEFYNKCFDIVQSGYEYNYSDLCYLSEPLTCEDSMLVYDILQMFHVISLSAKYDPSLSGHLNFDFKGFDANSHREGRLFQYASFLKKQGKFQSVLVRSVNSHMEMLSTYIKMLDLFKKLKPTVPHDEQDELEFVKIIRQILEAK